MFGLGFIEIIVIGIVVLLAVKPEDLPNFVKKIGRSYKELKNTISEVNKMKEDFVKIADKDIKQEIVDKTKKVLDSDDALTVTKK
ncbi:twin-arginine translocase TatA/TatE family subunit [Clostridia bacterium]|nr:twin-arginine translocase TatA/TatE family subunit [Clostridia bacterium]